ncbi:BatD family protein [Pseudomonadota bacterium]|nr:BatD family protein [Pseudomonadota bacterium]
MVSTVTSLISNISHRSQTVSLSILITLLTLFSLSATAADIDLSVDRSKLSLTESFQLTFSASETPDDDPDFSPLEQDFEILNQQKSSQLSWVNGSMNKSVQWILSVMAKRSGALQIPAISFGDDRSNAYDIMVNEITPSTATSNTDALYLEVDVSDTKPYVQAQVIYTVRLYQRVNFSRASISDVKLDNAVIESLGEATKYNTQVKGINYLVTELKYALFPQQSGLMTIEPLVLTAQVVVSAPRGLFGDPSTQTRRVMSKAIQLDVQAAPISFTGDHWLSAEQLELTQTWSNDDLHVKVGEPITRTLTISAKGTTSSQLPDLTDAELDAQLKVYPDQAVINDQKSATGIIAKREQKMAIIPSKLGTFTLAAIEVPWFNTRTNKMEVAQLPEVTLVAIAAQETTNTDNITPIVPTPVITETQVSPVVSDSTAATIVSEPSNPVWIWLTFTFLFAWLITLFYLFKSRFANTNTEIKSDNSNKKPKDIINDLKKACADNDPHSAHQTLIQWAKITYNVPSLAGLNEFCTPSLLLEINKLSEALYAKQTLTWDGSTLVQAVLDSQAVKSSAKTSDELLAPLYPS